MRLSLAPRPRSLRACGLPLDDGHLHVLDLDADEEEVDLAHDHVLQVVSRRGQEKRREVESLILATG